MNTIEQDPFALFEANSEMDLQAVFTQEAYDMLTGDNGDESASETLFKKVDNLLKSASEMLEYTQYMNIVQFALNCSGHNHAMQEFLQRYVNEDTHHEHSWHDHAKEDDKSKSKDTKKKTGSLLVSLLFSGQTQKTPSKSSFLSILLGSK